MSSDSSLFETSKVASGPDYVSPTLLKSCPSSPPFSPILSHPLSLIHPLPLNRQSCAAHRPPHRLALHSHPPPPSRFHAGPPRTNHNLYSTPTCHNAAIAGGAAVTLRPALSVSFRASAAFVVCQLPRSTLISAASVSHPSTASPSVASVVVFHCCHNMYHYPAYTTHRHGGSGVSSRGVIWCRLRDWTL